MKAYVELHVAKSGKGLALYVYDQRDQHCYWVAGPTLPTGYSSEPPIAIFSVDADELIAVAKEYAGDDRIEDDNGGDA